MAGMGAPASREPVHRPTVTPNVLCCWNPIRYTTLSRWTLLDDIVHAVDGPDPEFYRRLHALQSAATQMLTAADFRPGHDESLEFVAQDVVAVILGGASIDVVAQTLQAFAARPSAYIPPLPPFLPLARRLVALVRATPSTPDAV